MKIAFNENKIYPCLEEGFDEDWADEDNREKSYVEGSVILPFPFAHLSFDARRIMGHYTLLCDVYLYPDINERQRTSLLNGTNKRLLERLSQRRNWFPMRRTIPSGYFAKLPSEEVIHTLSTYGGKGARYSLNAGDGGSKARTFNVRNLGSDLTSFAIIATDIVNCGLEAARSSKDRNIQNRLVDLSKDLTIFI